MNVRWDAVVADNRFWTEPPRPSVVRPDAKQEDAAQTSVKVWLYGTLAGVSEQRPVELQISQDFTVTDVLAELSRRYGEGFSDHVIGPDGRKFRHCRVFVDGLPADDVDTPVHAGPAPALVEMILLTAIEGG